MPSCVLVLHRTFGSYYAVPYIPMVQDMQYGLRGNNGLMSQLQGTSKHIVNIIDKRPFVVLSFKHKNQRMHMKITKQQTLCPGDPHYSMPEPIMRQNVEAI